MNKKTDNIIALISLILAVISILNFNKVMLFVQLAIGVIILAYSIIQLKNKENKVAQLVFSIVIIANSILWLMFVCGIYQSLIG